VATLGRGKTNRDQKKNKEGKVRFFDTLLLERMKTLHGLAGSRQDEGGVKGVVRGSDDLAVTTTPQQKNKPNQPQKHPTKNHYEQKHVGEDRGKQNSKTTKKWTMCSKTRVCGVGGEKGELSPKRVEILEVKQKR